MQPCAYASSTELDRLTREDSTGLPFLLVIARPHRKAVVVMVTPIRVASMLPM